MSKRSSRRKRRQKQKKLEARLDATTLAQEGRKAFHQTDYDQAIKLWEQAKRKPNPPDALMAALAEAYFRRAVDDPTPRLPDLEQAANLQPADNRYRYHLALAYHRQGELSQAERLYRQLLAESPCFERAAAPLAQLLLEQKKAITKDPVWTKLDSTQQAQLATAEALLKNKAEATLRQLARKRLDPLWGGLAAVTLNDEVGARQQLQVVLDTSSETHPLLRSVARYYLGVLAATAGQPEAALEYWQTARSEGLNSRHLQRNLSALAYKQALEAQQAGRPHRAVELLEQVEPGQATALQAFQQQLNLELGYAAAQEGNWQQAVAHWEEAEQHGDDSRKLIYNLALGYQNVKRHRDAAEYWRSLLRRRPRKADHPDALTDQQVARIWQNVAENYSQAGDYDEAIKTYKNAVKWAPKNIDLRLNLVEAYQAEGRWQAAENELNRILDKEPDHIPALILLGESYGQGYWPGRARQIWLRILKLEPQHPVARQQLAHSYVIEGSRLSQWGMYPQAINIYQEGLNHAPNSQQLLVMMGGTYADWGKMKQARDYLEQARAANPDDLSTLHTIFLIWLGHNSAKAARQTFEHARAVTAPVPGTFFLDLAEHCYEYDEPELSRQILEYTEQQYPNNEVVLVGTAVGYLNLDEDRRAVSILRRVLQKNATNIEANIQLGLVYYSKDQSRLAKRHWQTAESQARKNDDHATLHRIKLMKDELLYGKTPPRNPLEMLATLSPEAREQLLSTAPPEIANILRDMSPLEMEMLLDMAAGFDDEFIDEDDFFR
jgi:tetratricopeptide (TPR) repeat protein